MIARRLGLLGLVLVLSSVPASPPLRAQEATTTFGGYDASASGSGLRLAPSLPGLLPVEVPIEGTLSLAFASLSTGGEGFGRASVLWPGTLVAGLRPLLGIAFGQQLPIPDYPIVIETRSHEDAKQNTQPGITMATNVKPESATATSDIGGFIIPAIIDVGSIRTVSTAVLEAERVVSTAITFVNGIDIAAGAIHIDQIKSTAIAISDGTNSTCEGGVTISGASSNGVPIAIDDKGVHVQAQTLLPGIDLNQALTDLLAATGLQLKVLGSANSCSGATANRTTSGLLLSLPAPVVNPIPPGSRVDIFLGSTSATASATPPFDLTGGVTPDTVPSGGGDGFVAPPLGSFGDGLFTTTTAAPSSQGTPPEVAAPQTTPIDYTFDGVPLALSVGLVLLAIPLSRPVRRYVERLIKLSTVP